MARRSRARQGLPALQGFTVLAWILGMRGGIHSGQGVTDIGASAHRRRGSTGFGLEGGADEVAGKLKDF